MCCVGQARPLPVGALASFFPSAKWLPDGRRFLVAAAEAGRPSRVYLQSIDGGDPQPVTAEGEFGRLAILADGERFVTRGKDRRLAIFRIAGGPPQPLAGAEARDLPIVASADGQWLYVQGDRDLPAGRAVSVMMRPEIFKLRPQARTAAGANEREMVIRDSVNYGESRLIIAQSGPLSIRTRVLGVDATHIAAGDNCVIAWDPKHVHVLA